MTPVVAAVAAACCVALPGRRWNHRSIDPRAWTVLLVVAVLGGIGTSAEVSVPVPLVILGVLVAWALVGELRRRRERRARERRSQLSVETCEALAADLRAGLPPIAALVAAAREWEECRPVLDAARLGGDVPSAWRDLAGRPGAEGLRTVAAAWVVAHRSGAGLAGAVELAARAMREDRMTSRVVETELASARATAKLLAALPVGVLLLGRGTGGDPFGFLLGTTPGLVCLFLGLGLMWCGLAWIERIARRVSG